MSQKKVIIGSDHRGVDLKAKCVAWLKEHGYSVEDVGTNSPDRCDAQDYALRLVQSLGSSDAAGILICGTGQAMAMTANRHRHIRAALCAEATSARLTRQHNDANVLVLGADVVGAEVAVNCVEVFLSTPFLGGRYGERKDKLSALGGL